MTKNIIQTNDERNKKVIINKQKLWVSLIKPVLFLLMINSINHFFEPTVEQLYYFKYLFVKDEIRTSSMISVQAKPCYHQQNFLRYYFFNIPTTPSVASKS